MSLVRKSNLAGVAAAIVIFCLWMIITLLSPSFLLAHFDGLLAVGLAFWPFQFYFNLFASDVFYFSTLYLVILIICILANGVLYMIIALVGQRCPSKIKTAAKIIFITAYWGLLIIFVVIF